LALYFCCSFFFIIIFGSCGAFWYLDRTNERFRRFVRPYIPSYLRFDGKPSYKPVPQDATLDDMFGDDAEILDDEEITSFSSVGSDTRNTSDASYHQHQPHSTPAYPNKNEGILIQIEQEPSRDKAIDPFDITGNNQ